MQPTAPPRHLYCFVPEDSPVEELDIARCLENTLHALEDFASAKYAPLEQRKGFFWRVMGLERREDLDEDVCEDEITDIDLGYVLPGPILFFERVPRTAVGFEHQVYEKYKLFRLMDTHVTLAGAVDAYLDSFRIDRGLPSFSEWEKTSCMLYQTFDEWLNGCYQRGDDRWFRCDPERKIWELDNPDGRSFQWC